MLRATQRVLIERERGPSSSLYGGDMAWIQVCPRQGASAGPMAMSLRCARNRGRMTVAEASAFGGARLGALPHRERPGWSPMACARSGLDVNKRPGQLV